MRISVRRPTLEYRLGRSRHVEARALAMDSDPLYDLLLLNVVLQLFDGMATYSGLHLGAAEANQLLRSAFTLWGVGPSLILFKTFACGTLLLLYRHAPEELGRRALSFLAGVYCTLSLIPWMAKLVAAALPIL